MTNVLDIRCGAGVGAGVENTTFDEGMKLACMSDGASVGGCDGGCDWYCWCWCGAMTTAIGVVVCVVVVVVAIGG